MTFFLHVRRNISRNPGRTAGVVLVVALTLGIFLVLSQLGAAIAAGSDQAVASVPNLVSVAPYTTASGQSAANVTPQTVADVQSTPNVTSVQRVYFFPLGVIGCGPSTAVCTTSGPPGGAYCLGGSVVTAEDTKSTIRFYDGVTGATADVSNVTQGRMLNAGDENSTNALVGQEYADLYDLAVGGAVGIGGTNFTIVGIFAGTGCTGVGIIVPYSAGTSAFGASMVASHPNAAEYPDLLYVTIDNYQDVAGVVSHLQSALGSNFVVQDVAGTERSQFLSGLNTVVLSSELGEYAALAIGAAVMVVLMTLVMSRRTKEVGLLKALGYGNGRILGQVLSESLIIALIGFPLAILLTYIAGPALSSILLSEASSVSLSNVTEVGGGAATITNPYASSVHFALTPETVILGAVVTIGFGVVGALYPTIRSVRLRPAEALRRE
ncbi:MAG: ABC transporter permease [Thaumarchaeota archaeon]|nr:ABC transporter permease [Nitrososphaerota archaeon]